MKITKDWVDSYFDHGVDVQNRRVWLIGEITEDSLADAVKGLHLLDTLNHSQQAELFISSYGGDLTEAIAMYDMIRTLRCPVHTFAFGKCMSAAPLLLSAGVPGSRWVTQHVEFMVHDFSSEIDGKGADMKAHLLASERTFHTYLSLLASNSNKPFSFWRTLTSKKTDTFFTAEDALKWGLADSMWDEKSGS